MNATYDITPRVMRRVYLVWVYRKITSPVVLKCVAFFYALVHLSFIVSYYDVWRNTSRMSVTQGPLYLSDAYLRTEHLTQTLIAVATFTGAWLVYDTARNVWKSGRFLPFTFSR